MKNLLKLEILKTKKSLTTEEQNTFRLKFKPLLTLEGIMSLCLEKKHLYVEYNPVLINMDSFKQTLIKSGYPLKLNPVQV